MSAVLLIGLGVEGRAAARYFLSQGWEVRVADKRADSEPCPDEFAAETRFHWSGESAAKIDHADLILRSPGVPPVHPLVSAAVAAGRDVTTPTGYWLQHLAPEGTLTVTGSKGKSTTVTLTVALLRALGIDAAPHGNIGLPPLDREPATAALPVLELSSYMLHDISDGPYTHLVTNLFREHTPWHGSEAAYHEAKLRPFRLGSPRPGIAPQDVIRAHSLPESVDAIEALAPQSDDRFNLSDGSLEIAALGGAFGKGPNTLALRAAIAAAHRLTGSLPPSEAVLAAATSYHGLPSRQEFVPSTDGRDWVNDALATIPEAVAHALNRFDGREITLLLGGADREQEFGHLVRMLAATPTVRPLIFGSIARRLAPALSDAGADHHTATTYEDALTMAASLTPKGGVILFSPGAASEPPHDNFAVRAEIFRQAASAA